jgi:vacuolar iron transporter family protein
LLAVLSFFVARAQTIPLWKVIGEQLFIVIVSCVVVMAHAVDDWVHGFVETE